MEYEVYGECGNCRNGYIIRANKGVPIPDKMICIYCEIEQLKKKTGKPSGYNAVLRWNGKKLEYIK